VLPRRATEDQRLIDAKDRHEKGFNEADDERPNPMLKRKVTARLHNG
jgi:hypothetical protein